MMSILNKIKSEDFIIDLGYQLPARPMHKVLSERSETLMFRESYQNGSIEEQEIKNFVYDLLKDFKYGENFYNDLTLATIAVALEKCYTDFAKEYLYDLSKLELTELKLAAEVAKVCLMERERYPSNLYKHYKTGVDYDLGSTIRVSILDPLQNLTSEIENHYA